MEGGFDELDEFCLRRASKSRTLASSCAKLRAHSAQLGHCGLTVGVWLTYTVSARFRRKISASERLLLFETAGLRDLICASAVDLLRVETPSVGNRSRRILHEA